MADLFQPGDLFLDKYRIERLVGKGAMGAVYAAMDVDLARRVAIKVLLPHAASTPQSETRFINEARATARIESEHVARVFAAGHATGGLAYMVLELLEGADLAATLRQRKRLPFHEAVDIVLEALEAIAEAHRHGIVHRDLKPGNLFLVSRSDGTELVKVLDFGISKAIHPFAASGAAQELTSVSALLGSPLYMAPEQLQSAKSVDHRADIWSLGVILYEALAGQVPFRGETLGELLAVAQEGKPVPVGRHRPDLPAELQAAVHRCLEPDLHRRMGDAFLLTRALTPFASRGRTSIERIRRSSDASPTLTSKEPGDATHPASGAPSYGERGLDPMTQSSEGWTGTRPRSSRNTSQPLGDHAWPAFLLVIPIAFIVAGCILVFFLFVRPKGDAAQARRDCSEPSVMLSSAAAAPTPTPASPPAPPATTVAVEKPVVQTTPRSKPVARAVVTPSVPLEEPSFDPDHASRK